MAEIKLDAETRMEFGKGAARRLRRENKVPAVLYGHGTDPVHIALPMHATHLALRQPNVLLSLVIEGKPTLVLPKQVQKDPVKNTIEHVDLIIVKRGEKVTVDIPVVVEGEAAPETVVVQDANTISLEADATRLPEQVVVNIDGLEAGTQILAGALDLPEGTTLVADPELLVVNITHAISQEALEAELAEAESELGIEPTEAEQAQEKSKGDEGTEGKNLDKDDPKASEGSAE